MIASVSQTVLTFRKLVMLPFFCLLFYHLNRAILRIIAPYIIFFFQRQKAKT